MVLAKDTVAEYLWARHLFDVPPGAEYTVDALGGGFLNTVLRVRCGGKSIVVKQAMDALRLFPDLKVTTDRIVFEQKALARLNRLFPEGTLPPVLHFDDENHLLVMGDLGEGPLLEEQLIKGQIDPSVAERLGQFLARQHSQTLDDPELRQAFQNEAMQQLRLQYCFYFVPQPALLDVAKRLGRLFTEEKRVLLHGDFWTGSVMTDGQNIRVFDFEFTYYGHPAQDIGFMMAHYLLHAYNTPALAKAAHEAVRRLWKTYVDGMAGLLPGDTERSALQQMGIEMLFRIDGINRVKYITDESVKSRLRLAAKRFLLDDRLRVSDLPGITPDG